METANKLKPEDPNISFDISVIKILRDFFAYVYIFLS